MRRVPEDLGLAGQLQRVAAVEVDEDQAALRIDRDVAERVEHAVAGIVRKQQQGLVGDQDEAGLAAAVRHIDSVAPIIGGLRKLAGDEQGVGTRDEGGLVLGQGFSALHQALLADLRDIAVPCGLASLDVLRAIAEALQDLDLEALRCLSRNFAVEAIAPARWELEPQGTNVRTLEEGLVQGIAVDRPCRHLQPAGVGWPQEAGLAGEDRSPGPAGRIERTDDQKGQPGKKFLMLGRHLAADHPAAEVLHLVCHAEAGLDLLLAPVKG